MRARLAVNASSEVLQLIRDYTGPYIIYTTEMRGYDGFGGDKGAGHTQIFKNTSYAGASDVEIEVGVIADTTSWKCVSCLGTKTCRVFAIATGPGPKYI